ncbi:MAG: helix-turn-helix domain-containing protein [Sphingobacteriaceae bacterium]
MDLQAHILLEVDRLFSRYGIKGVTMDDIAKHLGMSKKTIYQYFGNKNKLIITLMKGKIDAQVAIISEDFEQIGNAVDEIFISVNKLEEILFNTNPIVFSDLQKYYPEAWILFKDFREHVLYKKVLDNLERGIREKYYRAEINVEIIARMRIEQIDMAFNQMVFPVQKFSISQVIRELTDHFIYGICTDQGRKLMAYLKRESK